MYGQTYILIYAKNTVFIVVFLYLLHIYIYSVKQMTQSKLMNTWKTKEPPYVTVGILRLSQKKNKTSTSCLVEYTKFLKINLRIAREK